jgi:ABC-2 type transport system permease protein
MRRFAVLMRTFLLMNLREREVLFWFFVFPVGLLLILGVANVTNSEYPAQVAGWLLAGVLVMNLMSSGLTGDAPWLASMRDRGVLLRLRVAPLPVIDLVGSYALVKLALVMVQSALIVAAAMIAFGVRPGWDVALPIALSTLLGGFVFLLLGQAIAAVSPNANSANVVSNMIFFPVLFLSNLVIGLAAFPDWLQRVAQWSPAALLVDIIRPLLVDMPARHAAWINVAGLLVYALVAVVVIARWFRWQSRV